MRQGDIAFSAIQGLGESNAAHAGKRALQNISRCKSITISLYFIALLNTDVRSESLAC